MGMNEVTSELFCEIQLAISYSNFAFDFEACLSVAVLIIWSIQ